MTEAKMDKDECWGDGDCNDPIHDEGVTPQDFFKSHFIFIEVK